jgi:hypothetical protein
VENLLRYDGKEMDDCSVEELEGYWQKAKNHLSSATERE